MLHGQSGGEKEARGSCGEGHVPPPTTCPCPPKPYYLLPARLPSSPPPTATHHPRLTQAKQSPRGMQINNLISMCLIKQLRRDVLPPNKHITSRSMKA